MNVKRFLLTAALGAAVVVSLPGCMNKDSNPGANSSTDLIDTDNDGIPNVSDDDIDGDGIVNTEDSDIDGDGIANTDDSDMDGDGVNNIDDNDIDGDGIVNTDDDDIDGDGIANPGDSDLDGDGITNGSDNDIDGDGIPNNVDPDIDNDGIPNDQDSTPGGTGSDTDGTQGDINTGTDVNTGETGEDDYVSGIAVVATDTVEFSFSITSGAKGTKVSESDQVNLADLRDEIAENNIALSTVSIIDMQIKAMQTTPFIETNKASKIVLKFYYSEGAGQVKMLETAATAGLAGPVITVGSLLTGLDLNEEVFGSNPGYTNFLNMIKDESKTSVSVIAEIELLDGVTLSGSDLSFQLLLTTGGKKKL